MDVKKFQVLSEVCWTKELLTWGHFRDQFPKTMKNKWESPYVSLLASVPLHYI